MDDLKFLQQTVQRIADRVVDEDGADAAADDQKHRFIRGKMTEIQGSQTVAGQQLSPDRGTGQYGLALREISHSFREVAADFGGCRKGQLVGESRCQVGLVDDGGNPQGLCRENDRDRDKPPFGKYQTGTDPLQKFSCLEKALHHMERVRKVFQVKVAPQLSG